MLKMFLAITASIGTVIINLVRTTLYILKTAQKNLECSAQKYIKPVVLRFVSKVKHFKRKTKKTKIKESSRLELPFMLKGFGIGFLACFLFVFVPYSIYSWFKLLPSPEGLAKAVPPLPTQILDSKGRLLFEVYQDKKSEPVKLDQVPDHFKNALIAVEDSKFYSHPGVDLKGLIRAAYQSIAKDNLQGGSTITQQLVKNVLLSPERTVSRKLKEGVLSILAERIYTKDQILEMYINNIPFGGVAIGAQAAADKYFGKDISELDIAESAMLAGLPGAPTSYSPILDLESAKKRQLYVLQRMVDQGYLTQEQMDTENNKTLHFYDQGIYIRAPHFVSYVIEQLKDKYGERMLYKGGLKIYTSLDLDLQDQVDQILEEEISKNGKKLYISNGAALVIDVENSSILAYQGSVDYFKDSWGSFDVVRAPRQPGSSIKPVTYSLALSNGFTAASIINDGPVRYTTKGSAPYSPVNYDGRFHGNVSLRQALANSYNIPAVKIAAVLGADKVKEQGRKLGLRSWEGIDNYGLSITLGGVEVSLLELTNVYATFARGGVAKELNSIVRIEQSDGQVLFASKETSGERVLTPEVSYILSHILSDNNARQPAFGVNNNLSIPGYTVAVKTGTTDNKRDNWTLGYTPSFAVGVWVGNNNNTVMNQTLASGLSGAAPIWNKITTYMLKNTAYNRQDFLMPDGIYVMVDKNCNGKSEVFVKSQKYPLSLCQPIDNNKAKNEKKRAETPKTIDRSDF
ncbi:PBP1A family penicillin-binding protein [candidate division WWE3 bacterium]|uniref:PBP1A family penicillin-binding protein n=1 Tax=candidate division WWE3 bacterium TaxID=2053526 RepID=A0A7X9HG96_UNCKA|nr:PBP1A family penicillin-binding protein [candidate division WWE3 bacterium]